MNALYGEHFETCYIDFEATTFKDRSTKHPNMFFLNPNQTFSVPRRSLDLISQS